MSRSQKVKIIILKSDCQNFSVFSTVYSNADSRRSLANFEGSRSLKPGTNQLQIKPSTALHVLVFTAVMD